jgi:CRISPR/Cas system CMR-associated protein Cmr5 small subunit
MNKYLEKAASLGSAAESAAESVKGFGKDFAKGWKRSSTTSKVGLMMSGTGLGLGVANYKNGVENKHNNVARGALERESLNELKGISDTLKKKQHVTVTLNKEASLRDAARDAYSFAKRNPLTAAGAVIGSADGALSTTKKPKESVVRTGLRGIRNIVTGGVTGAVVGSVGDHLKNKYIR